MLKSQSTQFALALFFGPVGLAYTSVASAVLLTLAAAVLFFYELGPVALLACWAVAIVLGAVYVKLNNDRLRQTGASLLLGPEGRPGAMGLLGIWARGVSVLALLVCGGFLLYQYAPASSGTLSRVAAATGLEGLLREWRGSGASDDADVRIDGAQAIADNRIIARNPDGATVVELPDANLQPVLVETSISSRTEPTQAVYEPEYVETVYVREALVNLRQGPGTSYPVITTLRRGEELLKYVEEGSWVSVESTRSGVSGWIFGKLVR